MSEASIWQKLRSKGFSEKATAAIMGNMQAESGLIPYRIQGDFSYEFERSIEYTRKVDSGAISRSDFLYNGPGGGGYGLVQWTYWSRKAGLYDLAKSRGVSIGDEQLAIDWFYQEVQQSEYSKTWNALKSDGSIYDMTAVMLRNYEKPYDQSDSAAALRAGYANQIYERNAGTPTPSPEPEPSPEPSPKPEPSPSTDSCEITARILKKGDKGRDVGMAQWALLNMEYDLGETGPNHDGVDGDFGKKTEDAVNSLKEAIGLATDGAIDEDVWQILFQ